MKTNVYICNLITENFINEQITHRVTYVTKIGFSKNWHCVVFPEHEDCNPLLSKPRRNAYTVLVSLMSNLLGREHL